MNSARVQRIVKGTLAKLFDNEIFCNAVSYLYADGQIERQAFQIYTSAPLFISPRGVTFNNSVGTGD